MFKGKRILVTGGAGSVGQAIIHKVLQFKPEVVRILDISEIGLFELEQQFKKYDNLRFLLGNIRDKDRMKRAIEGVDIVFHTASLKHVQACEYNPFEAVKTNVMGTQNLIEVSMEEEVDRVIFTSSDKAVNPRNVMGATKLLAERLMISANYYKGARKTVFSSVRFGNVLGSSGSVIAIFSEAIQRGGPVTITDKEMTRFVMTMDNAVNLLFKATEIARGGEIFVFKMGALKILDLANVMIEILGPQYGHSTIKIKTIGVKPGEKLYEELMTEDESRRALEAEDMFIIPPEIEEIQVSESSYPPVSTAEIASYTSRDLKPLSKGQITELLAKENLL